MNLFVAGFVGEGQWISGAALGFAEAEVVLLRPHQLKVSEQGALRATLTALAFRGPHYSASVRFATGEAVEIDLAARDLVPLGESLTLLLVPDDLVVFRK